MAEMWKIRLGNWFIGGFVQKYEDMFSVGLTNETDDNYFMPWLDYDEVRYDKVVKDISHLQSVFSLNSAVVLRSKEEVLDGDLIGNYLVFFLDKVNYGMCAEMIRHSRCDSNFKFMPKRMATRSWVLRVSSKDMIIVNKDGSIDMETFKPNPKFKDIVESKNRLYELSRPHMSVLQKIFGCKKIKGNFDKCKDVEWITYRVWSG